MDQPKPPPVRMSALESVDVIEYQAVSGLAVVALLLGLLAAGALIWPLFWIVPPLGIVVGGVALGRIVRQSPELTGRKLATAGLMLSIFFAAMVPAEWFTYRWAIRSEAHRFAAIWFETFRNGEPIKAFQLTVAPRHRLPLEEVGRRVTTIGSDEYEGFKEFGESSDVRSLLALGEKALVRHYATESQVLNKGDDLVEEAYAVTYEDGGEKKTFFLRLVLGRKQLDGQRGVDWQVVSRRAGYRPVALQNDGE